MPSRFWRAAAVLVPSLLLASLGAAASAAAATTSNPSLITSDFACSNGTCEVGPGNVGVAFDLWRDIGSRLVEPLGDQAAGWVRSYTVTPSTVVAVKCCSTHWAI